MPVMILDDDSHQFLVNFVGHLASFFAIAQLLVGLLVVRKIIKKGQATDVQLWPMIAMLCSASVWLKYGLLKMDKALIIVNSIAIILQTFYVTVYYRYSNIKGFVHKQIGFGAFLVFPVLIYLRLYIVAKEEAERILGFYCSTLSVMSYGSPLSAMSHVIRTRNSEIMFTPLVVLNVVLGVQWTYYGFLRHDPFIQVPNFIGLCLGSIQLGLKCMYPERRVRTIYKTPMNRQSVADDNII